MTSPAPSFPARTPTLRALITAIGTYFGYNPYMQWALPYDLISPAEAKDLSDAIHNAAGRLGTVQDDTLLRSVANAIALNKGNVVVELFAQNTASVVRLSNILLSLRQAVNRYLAARARTVLIQQNKSDVANDLFSALGASEVGSLIHGAIAAGDTESTALQKLVDAAAA